MKVRARLSLRWASLLPTRKQLVVFLREILAQTERTTTRANAGSTSERRWWKSSKNRFIASNNVGVEIAKIFFVSIAYCPWCARRDSNPHDVTHCHLKAARLPIPPRALKEISTGIAPDRINGAGCNKSGMEGQGPSAGSFGYRVPGDFGSICLTSTAMRL